MFKLQTIILTALVAASVQVNAWTVQVFADPACTHNVLQEFTTGEQPCTDLFAEATAFTYTPDASEPLTLQLFSQQNCGPAFLQTPFAINCSQVGVNTPILSFAVV